VVGGGYNGVVLDGVDVDIGGDTRGGSCLFLVRSNGGFCRG